jgi:filamentous hemagglutinin family protein
MIKSLSLLLQVCLYTIGCFLAACEVSLAQVTSDGTVNTQVNQNGNVSEITGGEAKEGNLFHSFQDFSVPTGNEAAFLNADNIANIFSRVTGGNISNIDGLISANGSANLFLINPAGIIFGENARLDVGGSFLASTADSILFEDGEFSATDLNNPPVLTINAPIGLNLRDQPVAIVNRSVVQDSAGEFVGLEVLPGKNLAFVGGNVNFEAGDVTARGGNVELGGLSAAGTVGINPDGSFSFPESVARADVNFKVSDVDVRGTGGGNITVNARNLFLKPGEFNGEVFGSLLRAGIIADSTSPEAQAGDITINATESVALDSSFISNDVEVDNESNSGTGNSGNLNINTPSLSLTNFSSINADIYGQGNAGLININASEAITLDESDISSTVSSFAKGNGGDLNITTPNLSLNGSSIKADIFGQGNAGNLNINTSNISLTNFGSIGTEIYGQGNGGSIDINASESITLNESNISNSVTFVAEGNGNGGDLNITTPNLSLNGGSINADTRGQGDGGKLSITTANLSLTNFGSISGETSGKGDAGLIDINATESITLNESSISSTVSVDTEGNGGEINITTPNLSLNGGSINVDTFGQGDGGKLNISTANLSLTNFGSINGDTLGQGNGGSIDINATESITLDNSFSGISSGVQFGAKGNGGELNITTPNLSLINDSGIDASTYGQGDAGSIDINATESITLDKFSSISSTASSRLFNAEAEGNGGNIQISTGDFSISNDASVNANTSGIGNGGEINIIANNLSLTNGGDITASTFGYDAENIAQGDGGNITIDVADTLSINSTTTFYYDQIAGIFASNQGDSNGNAGNIDITASKLSLINGSQINSFTRGSGDAGNTTINAQDSIFLSGEDSEGIPSGIFNNVEDKATGNGGTIKITTENLDLVDGAEIAASSEGQGDAGLIDIDANILSLDNGNIFAQAFNNANGGNLKIDANVIVAYPNSNSDILASAEQGEGGNITINADSIFGIEERPLNKFTSDINATSQVRGANGNVNVDTLSVNPVEGSAQLPINVVEPEQTTQQACEANREAAAKNGLTIEGKGGIPATPVEPLESQNIFVLGQYTDDTYTTPEPVKTSQGTIQPARGIKTTEDGSVILTAYPTNNAGERIPEGKANCGQI